MLNLSVIGTAPNLFCRRSKRGSPHFQADQKAVAKAKNLEEKKFIEILDENYSNCDKHLPCDIQIIE